MNPIGAIAVREGAFPSRVRFLKCNRQIGGEPIEADRISSRAVEIIIRRWIVGGIVEWVVRQPCDFAWSHVVDVILGGKFLRSVVASGERVIVHSDLPDGLRRG